jgi:hypothetical protein
MATVLEQRSSALRVETEQALAGTVAELTARHGGGTPFFDALDERMRDPRYFDALVDRALTEFPDRQYYPEDGVQRIVVSGKFGILFGAWFMTSQWTRVFPRPPLVVKGDLRHNDLPPFIADQGWRLDENAARQYPMKYVFLDDSAFKFRTFNKIKEQLERAGGDLVGQVVLYDGSREPRRIPSFYRWHPDEGVKA